MTNDNIVPKEWDRNGLPGWSYFSENLLDVENEELFRKHWQLVCHTNDIPEPGDYHTYDIAKERALVIRGHDRTIRAFHNLCRHRGARVVRAKLAPPGQPLLRTAPCECEPSCC